MSTPPATERRLAWLLRPPMPAILLLVAATLAWSNTWHVPFVFDDHSSIVENRSLREFAPLSWLNPPHAVGETVSGRPVLNFSFALNYAFGGLDVRSYHVLNLLIHALGALALFGIVRRTRIAGEPHHDGLALVVALVWLLHPLQTESVTYIVQRAESLMGLFSFLTLYCFVRSVIAVEKKTASPQTAEPARRRVWLTLSVLFCLLGAGTKESIVTAPVLVFIYDRTFVAGSFAAAWRTRRGYYLALVSSWIVVAGLMLMNGGNRGGTFDLAGEGAWVGYWLTQFKAIVTYLGLTFWPHPLVFEYGAFHVSDAAEILPQALLVLGLGFAALFALWRRPAWGFLGLSFFGLLAPSSTFPGISQMIVEHRMYLPLAAVVVATGVAIRAALRRANLPPWSGAAVAAVVIVALGATTFARNGVYASEVSLWGDTATKRPDNARAHYNYGMALAKAGRADEAQAEFLHTLAAQPNHAFAHFELGKAAMLAGRAAEAAERFDAALQADVRFIDARVNLANVLARLGKIEDAVAHYRTALAEQPAADIRLNLAGLLIQLGRHDEAAPLVQQTLAEAPELPEAHYHWARLRERAGDRATAEEELRAALRLRPDFGVAAMALGNLLARQGRFAEAVEPFRVVLAGEPGSFQARNNLANCYLALNRLAEAIAEYETILQSHPNDASVRTNLEVARSMRGTP